ncbi:MAG: glycoside hydrolase family 16 protein [Desulfuromonadales bacterium]|nr:glycoside hydrolase family 16 protein [Desulfuromonadales bacterium]
MNLSLYKLAFFLVIIFSLSSCGTGSGPASIPDSAEIPGTTPPDNLLWSDEFNGTSLNTAKWNIETGYGSDGWGNDEWQLYTDSSQNIKVENGNLVITARCDSGECGKRDGSITSARINTKGKFTAKYGSVQARIKTPPGQGMWSAFWMLGSSFDAVGWPYSGEIDIMEMHDRYSNNYTVQAAAHWSDPASSANDGWTYTYDAISFDTPLTDDFHVYELTWDEDRIVVKVDGQQYYVQTINPSTMDEFLNDFFLLLNVAVGGTLGADPVTNQSWQYDMLVDWVRVYGEAVEPPPAGSEDAAGIYSESHTATVLPYSQIINSADWSGNITVPIENSTGVTPVDGSYVLEVDYQTGITDWGGIALDMNAADFSPYSVLAFNIDTSAVPTFADMKIEIEDVTQSKTSVQLADYRSVVNANWRHYEIPLTDFSGADLTRVEYLGFYSPVDGSNALIDGSLYFDDIYLDVGCVSSGSVLFYSQEYPEDTPKTTLTVADLCSADSTVAVAVDNGVESIAVDVTLDAEGNGTSQINMTVSGATDDSSDLLQIMDGDLVTASYTDANNNVSTDTVDIVAAGPRTVVADADGDGAVYLFAADATTTIDLNGDGSDYSIDSWSSGSVHDNAYAVDPVYQPVFSVVPGTNWGLAAGAVAFVGFDGGFASTYDTLHFKFKGDYPSARVKFSNTTIGPELEKEYSLSSANAMDLGNGWYELSIRLSDFPVLTTATEFAILNFGTAPFYLTDIYFE